MHSSLNTVHEVARSFSNAGTNGSSIEGPQLSPHSPIHLALPLAWDCKKKIPFYLFVLIYYTLNIQSICKKNKIYFLNYNKMIILYFFTTNNCNFKIK